MYENRKNCMQCSIINIFGINVCNILHIVHYLNANIARNNDISNIKQNIKINATKQQKSIICNGSEE